MFDLLFAVAAAMLKSSIIVLCLSADYVRSERCFNEYLALVDNNKSFFVVVFEEYVAAWKRPAWGTDGATTRKYMLAKAMKKTKV